MLHWDMILIVLAAFLWAVISLVLAIRRARSEALKLVLPALLLGIITEVGFYSLKGFGDTQSLWWKVWAFIHLPASLAVDPLPVRVAQVTMVGLNSVIAAGVWYFALKWMRSTRKSRPDDGGQ